MSLLTVDEFRALATTTLDDAPLGTLLDAAEIAINRQVGAVGARTEMPTPDCEQVILGREAASIDAVTETRGATVVTLDPDDYQLLPGARILERLATGPHPARQWRGRVTVSYTRVDDEADRKRVQRDLVLLELDRNGAGGVVTQQRLGDFAESYATSDTGSYDQRRAELLASLNTGWLIE